jgi:uncharacterized protein
MPSNVHYAGPGDLPDVIPVFPLAGALLLPRGHMPLNIFEPRYIAMIDHALRGDRLIGMVQPLGDGDTPELQRVGCVGRLTEYSETGDGRCIITLTGIARYRIVEEQATDMPFRLCRVAFEPFHGDFEPRAGEDAVNRDQVLAALRAFSEAKSVEMDWEGVSRAPNEALVNALAMMSPYGVKEKQALLEAADLKTRAELLVAITEIELSKEAGDGEITVQ